MRARRLISMKNGEKNMNMNWPECSYQFFLNFYFVMLYILRSTNILILRVQIVCVRSEDCGWKIKRQMGRGAIHGSWLAVSCGGSGYWLLGYYGAEK
jgi:hypothetical protein